MSRKSFWRALSALLVFVFIVSLAPQAQQAGAQQEGGDPRFEEIIPSPVNTPAPSDTPELVERGRAETAPLAVTLTPQRVSESCWLFVWDPREAWGTWDMIGWSPLTDQKGLADWGRDGADVWITINEDPNWGTPTSLTFSGVLFNIDTRQAGARLEFEPVRNGSGLGFVWYADSQNLGDPAYFQVEAPNSGLYSANGLRVRTAGGRQVGWDYLRFFKCYNGVPLTATPTNTPRPTNTPVPTQTPTRTPTPTPTVTPTRTRTPSPTPTVTPTIADDTLWLATPAPVVQNDNEGDVCKVAHLPIAGGTGLAREPQSPESWPNSSPQVPAPTQCYSPSHMSSIPPGACLNPTRRLVVKQSTDGTMAWSVEYQCPTQTQGAVMMTSTGANPIVGPAVALVVLTMAALSSPTTIEVVVEPAGQALAQGGSFIAASLEEGLDAVLALAVKPSTQYLGNPLVYAQVFDGVDIAGIFRGYRQSVDWNQTVWQYPATAGIDGNTVASLQYFTEGSRGPVLKTVIFKSAPNSGAGYPLWDASVQMFLDGYPANPLYPGLPPRTGEHSDKTPAESARKRWGYNEYMNRNHEWRQAGIRPPHKWCGIRPSDGACTCVDYTIQVVRWVVNGVGKVKMKLYEGAALVWSSNPTILMGLTQRVQGAQPFTDGARPNGNQWNEYRTVDLNNPSDLDQCPDHFGLRLAGRATDQGIPASMLPEGGETQ